MPIVTTEMPVEGAAGTSPEEVKQETTATAPTDKSAGESPEAAKTAPENDPEALADDEGDDDGDDGSDEGSKKGDVPRGVRKRIGKLTGEVKWLREQLAAATQRQVEPAPAPQAEPVAADKEPSPDDFESYVDYMTARAEWRAEQKVKEALSKVQAEAAMQRQQAEFMKKVEPFRAELKDFNEVIQSVPRDIVPSKEFSEAIALSELGPLVGYTLAKDHAELRRIMALPPVLQVIEFAKVEQRLAAERNKPKDGQRKAPPPPPAPPTTLDKGTSVKNLTSAEVANDYMAWKKLRDAEAKARRR